MLLLFAMCSSSRRCSSSSPVDSSILVGEFFSAVCSVLRVCVVIGVVSVEVLLFLLFGVIVFRAVVVVIGCFVGVVKVDL